MAAKRDMTQRQFAAAVVAAGFAPVDVGGIFSGIYYTSVDPPLPNTSFSAIVWASGPKAGQLARRDSVAYLIRRRKEQLDRDKRRGK